jgi:hypothetical protein
MLPFFLLTMHSIAGAQKITATTSTIRAIAATKEFVYLEA